MDEKVHSPKIFNRVRVGVAKVAVSNDTNHIGTAGHDGVATLWSVGSNSLTKIMEEKIDMPGRQAIGLLHLVFASNNRCRRHIMHHRPSHQPWCDISVSVHLKILYVFCIDSCRTAIACGGSGTVLVMDINALKTRKLEHPGIRPREVMLCLSISKSSRYVAASSSEVGHFQHS